MSEVPDQEPIRWLDDPGVDAALRADLVLGASAKATGVDYASSLVALRSAIAAQTGALAPAAATGKSVGFKAIVGGLLIAGAAGAWALRGDAPAVASSEVVASSEGVASSEVVETPRAAAAQTSSPARAPDHAASPARDPDPTPEPLPTPEHPPTPEPDATPEPDPTPEPIGASSPAAPGPERPNERPLERTAEEADASPRPDSRRPSPPAAEDDRFLREAKLVAQARKQLGLDPAAALASTERHAREFKEGALVEERRAIGIRALAKLGRDDEAQREGADFLREFGDGPHADAVRRVIADAAQ